MANLKQLQAALLKKEADLDVMDAELEGMPEMAPDALAEAPVSPEFDLLSEKREELETEIREMREGVELISQWEKFKDGPWSEQIKGLLSEIDIEISDIAGGEVAAEDELGGMAPDISAPMGAPAPDMAAPAAIPPAPEAIPEPAPAPEIPAEPMAEAAPLEPPMASANAGNPLVGKKNSYASPVKKGVSARSDMKKEGSNMATPTPAKTSVQEKLAEVKTKRDAIKREAQQRVAAAWTIAKTMLPTAPAEVQKSAASSLLQNSTKALNAMLRQTAKNAYYSKIAETFKQVHKVEMNDLLEDPSILSKEKKAVESEVKGDPKNAAVEKKADDRKDAGPQLATFDDGRCSPSKDTTPAEMHADSSKSETQAEHRPMDTINKSEGDKAGKEASAKKQAAHECKCEGECKCPDGCKCVKEASVDKTAQPGVFGGKKAPAFTKEDAKKKESAEKCADCAKMGAGKMCAKHAAVKTAQPEDMPPMDAPAEDMPPMDAEAPMGEAPIEEAPMDAEAPAEMPMDEGAEADTAGEILSDEKKMVVEEKIEEAQEAIKALEQEILQEGEEELDLAQVFNEEDMEEKVSALANEGDEHVAGNGEEFFAPSAAESMEASLDDTQIASMEDFFSLQGSDSDPLRALIAGEVRTAAEVAGMEVVPSFTGEAAKHFESDSATGENRDNENDHEGDLFAEAIEDQKPEDGGFKRVKQDETNVMQAPKSAKKTTAPAKAAAPVIKKLKNVTASERPSFDIAGALLGDDEF
jgi:hypothetical protein